MKHYLLRFWEPNWVHMYPERNGEIPISYTLDEANEQQEYFRNVFDLNTRIIPESEGYNYEIPKRW